MRADNNSSTYRGTEVPSVVRSHFFSIWCFIRSISDLVRSPSLCLYSSQGSLLYLLFPHHSPRERNAVPYRFASSCSTMGKRQVCSICIKNTASLGYCARFPSHQQALHWLQTRVPGPHWWHYSTRTSEGTWSKGWELHWKTNPCTTDLIFFRLKTWQPLIL